MNEEIKSKSKVEEREEPMTSGCPSLGLPKLPEGFDGTERVDDNVVEEKDGSRPLSNSKSNSYEQWTVDAFHMLNEAFISAPVQREARPGYFKTVLGDLVDALTSVVPCERVYKTPDAEMDVVIDNLTPDLLKRICERHGLKKRMTHAEYYTVADDCTLKRFKATNATRLIAVRKGREGNADFLYEISVDHDNATAVISRDGEMLYQIKTLGLSHRRCIHAAIQVLRAHLHENDGVHRRHHLSRKRRHGILTPEQELAETVKRQKELDKAYLQHFDPS